VTSIGTTPQRAGFEHWLRLAGYAITVAVALAWVLSRIVSHDFLTVPEAVARERALESRLSERLAQAEVLTAERQAAMSRRLDEQSETLREIHRLLLQERRR
jgi:predicted trehalose synthase